MPAQVPLPRAAAWLFDLAPCAGRCYVVGRHQARARRSPHRHLLAAGVVATLADAEAMLDEVEAEAATGSCRDQRFAFYGRLSTDDKQDQTLARPSQLKACQRKAAELGGEVVCEFFDQESGAKDDRPGWTALTQEARDRDSRRFDAVVIYQTSRLSRDRVSAGLFQRELRKVGVEIHYAIGAGDPGDRRGRADDRACSRPSTSSSAAKLVARDQARHARERLCRASATAGARPTATARALQRPPGRRARQAGERKSRLVPDPDAGPVIAEIFHLWADQRLGLQGDRRPPQPPRRPALPQPRRLQAQPPRRLGQEHHPLDAQEPRPTPAAWSGTASTSPPSARPAAPPACAPSEEWVVSEVAHLPLVSDELFAAAQERFRASAPPHQRPRNGSKRAYLFAGMVRCASGHQPLAM